MPKAAKRTPKKPKESAERLEFETVTVPIDDLKPHPKNYKKHPEDQLEHVVASIREHGIYKNVVVARDHTILAGHGVVLALRKMGVKFVPVRLLRVDPDDPRALKVMAGDNEISRLAETDDRALTELLKTIKASSPTGLMGSGFLDQQLAALAMISRPASEILDMNAAAAWVGMPAYEEGSAFPKITVTFRSLEDRDRFKEMAKLRIDKMAGLTWTTRWPFTEREDGASVRFEVAV